MKLRVFGFELGIAKAYVPASPAGSWLGWWPRVRESFTGAWQQNVTIANQPGLLCFSAVYATVTGIASDIAKMRIKLEQDVDGIWTEIKTGSPWLPVLRKPNHYQNRLQFLQQWIVSKLLAGNTYALKGRDERGIVTTLYILDPLRVRPLVTDDGGVYYQLNTDALSQVEDAVTVPAGEMIHDVMCPLWHPLVGVPPIVACAASANQGLKIQESSTHLFGNRAMPGGILTAPGHIGDDTALRLKTAFEANFSGANFGRLAVLGDGLKFEPMVLTAESSQLVEQLKWTVEDVARAFHYPTYKLGGGVPPYSSGPEALTMQYYTDCLQPLVEALELCLEEGLRLPVDYHCTLDIENLLRMDTQSLYDSNNKGVSGAWLSPNEARFRANLQPVDGGDSPMIQQQNYSLEALAKRDSEPQPITPAPPAVKDLEAQYEAEFDLEEAVLRR